MGGLFVILIAQDFFVDLKLWICAIHLRSVLISRRECRESKRAALARPLPVKICSE